MHACPSPRPALRRGRATIVAIATATCFLTFAAASLAATGSVYVDGKFNIGAGHDFFGGTAPENGDNVGVGYSIFPNLTTGNDDTAVGRAALRADTSGQFNTASGDFALTANTSGDENVATGSGALTSNKTGRADVAVGVSALAENTADNNVGVGQLSLFSNTTGSDNVAIGQGAGLNLTTGSDNIDIANDGIAGEQKAIRIGTKGEQTRTWIAGISGRTVNGTGQPVVVNSQGQLGTASAAKTAASKAATDRRFARMEAEMKRLERQNRRQGKEIRALRARR
jgi:hypothetical protein